MGVVRSQIFFIGLGSFALACSSDATARHGDPQARAVDTIGVDTAAVARAIAAADPDPNACHFSFEVDRMPEVDPAVWIAPAYPEALRQRGIEGSVRARFVVDTSGRVDSSTFRVEQSSHRYFDSAVRRSLRKFHYLPAEKDGHRVRCWTEQRFDFSLTDASP